MKTQTPTQELDAQQGTALSSCRDSDPLCERCRSIDFDAILSQRYSHDEIVPIMNLERLPLGGCALCRLFAQYCDDDWGDGLLCSVSWVCTKQKGWEGQRCHFDVRMLGILPTRDVGNVQAFFRKKGYIAEPNSTPLSWRDGPIAPRSLDPEAIDYSLLRGWLHFCQFKHGSNSYCPPSEIDSKWPIRLIDCETRLIVNAASLGSPCPPFLALSYVWGQLADLQDRQLDHNQPLEDLPLTIEDSILVTQNLELRYLWVDKYCIRQDDEQDKRCQIRLMTEIYGSAQATIVAAAGSDPTYGLPGVSRTRRVPQPHARLKNRTLTWTFGTSSPEDDVSSSVWSTRGWTYQEGLLSSRRLVFTDKQVYFQCGLAAFYEACNIPLNLESWTRQDMIFPRVRNPPYHFELGDRIHEYTRRKLGNEADILNAFQGLLGEFAKHTGSAYNIWGIPVLAWFDRSHDLWLHLPKDFLAGICWTLEMPGDRRHGFPSWSWAGWKGAVKSSYTDDAIRASASEDTDIAVSFESPDGTRTEWSQIEPMLGAGGDQDHLRTLVLDCRSFPFENEIFNGEVLSDGAASSMESLNLDTKTRVRIIGDLTGYLYHLCSKPSCGSRQLPQSRLLGIPLGLQSSGYGKPRLFILVVQKKTELWERVGHFEWTNPGATTDFRTFLDNIRTTRTVLKIA